MQYCINALLKNNNEIMQYYIINNDIALIMHYCALLQMPVYNLHIFCIENPYRSIRIASVKMLFTAKAKF